VLKIFNQKTLSTSQLQNLQKEVEIFNSVPKNPDLTQLIRGEKNIYSNQTTQTTYTYLAYEFCPNNSLEKFISQNLDAKRLPESDAIYYLKQVINGFLGIYGKYPKIDIDLRPKNLLVSGDRILIKNLGLMYPLEWACDDDQFEYTDQFYPPDFLVQNGRFS
jgi:serine/threonine protein kinase